MEVQPNINEFREMVTSVGGTSTLGDTRSDICKRVFVITAEGVTVGRASFRDNIFYSFKSYKKEYHRTLDESDMLCLPLLRLLNGGELITREKINDYWKKAQKFVAEDLAAKQKWREENPRFNKHGQPASRPKLQGRNPRSVLIQMMQEG